MRANPAGVAPHSVVLPPAASASSQSADWVSPASAASRSPPRLVQQLRRPLALAERRPRVAHELGEEARAASSLPARISATAESSVASGRQGEWPASRGASRWLTSAADRAVDQPLRRKQGAQVAVERVEPLNPRAI